ncbi:terminase small subunit protein [Methylocystis echinoides]|uniref:Terminase small subunit protein n=1 Tax=Methylocystis echinoides TaxID=29468 RepID=A0A9W6GU70_9HYPH|nr:terminase small subunit protein [Methylocystis echinoides]GLI92995.1 hypothetical protein LMG27198_19870 [Methylocystis echinoides]
MAAERMSFTEEIAEELCERLSEGESMRQICRDDHLPNRRTVERWMAERPDFAASIARAREGQADCLHDDMAEIEGEIRRGELDPQAARVIIWSKQWRASKLAPKKYGDKVQAEMTGKDGGPIETRDLTPLELARRVAFVFAKGEREREGRDNG